MDYIKKFLRDESGVVGLEYAVLAIASGLSRIWDGGFYGIWNSLIDNPPAFIFVLFTLAFLLWVMLKA